MAQAPRDDNHIPTLLAVSNVDGTTPVVLWADPTTHRLLVSSTASVSELNDIGDVTITAVASGEIIKWNGSAWINNTLAEAGIQAQGDVLDDFNTLGAAASDGQFIVATGAGAFAYESGATVRTSLGLGSAAVVNTDLSDLNEATIEAAIDTLANLTSIQGRTVTLADAGANAIFGWDDAASAYENLTQAEVLAVIGDSSATAKGVVELATDAEAVTGTDTARAVTPANLTARLAEPGAIGGTTASVITGTTITANTAFAPDADDGATLGTSSLGFADLYLATGGQIFENNANPKRPIVLSAAGGAPLTTAGCSEPTKVEAATNDINYYVLDFDNTTEEHAFWNVVMPDNYDGGTLTARFHWTTASGLATETVVWGIAMLGLADNDAIDSALGTEITVTDTFIAQGDLHKSSESSAITPAGSPVGGEMMNIVVARKTASDDLTGDARLIAVHLEYGINAYSG